MSDVTRFILKGVPGRSIAYTRFGQTLLDNLLTMMKFQNLKQFRSRVVLRDGTEIVCQSVFGQNQVTITTAVSGVEKRKFLMSLKGANDRYLIALGDQYQMHLSDAFILSILHMTQKR